MLIQRVLENLMNDFVLTNANEIVKQQAHSRNQSRCSDELHLILIIGDLRVARGIYK